MPSSAIRTFDYDPERRQLWVKIISGKTYVYDRVPEELPEAFRAAQSKGTFFNR